ncbi:family 16 glycosylhydrolase [Pseudoflavitalea sp. G-6-1-2]|uniref:family 16 glycosylhydrolase n=1 Tax=Pseudoflavitalea sp. G-6-1-2 TaxID=2728841 RepID=UPI001F0F75BF|nr:family 16 glycosylhydrolase [Pseudoflavitalea sp. G-6-1-2]
MKNKEGKIAGYNLYWSNNNQKPPMPNALLNKGRKHFYIKDVLPETHYHIWIETFNETGVSKSTHQEIVTTRQWYLQPAELTELQLNPSSAAVPSGMQLFWQDEFNDSLLDRNKWTTNYFSSFNYLDKTSKAEMLSDQLPQPAYRLNGRTIELYVNDTLPTRLFTPKGNQKISSIQTYDWRTNEQLLDNSRGGYFEARVKRSSTGNPKGLNTAFWFDSPGPDLKYYLEQGTELDGVKGIRPKGQVFEIDIFEYLTAQFVLHGHVDKNGRFEHNIDTHIATGYEHRDQWVTHGILWTPTSIQHYINGNLIKAYTDKRKIMSPNHLMSVFLGSYGSDGTVSMEVDYIRAYNWPLQDGNELPNPGFEYSSGLQPWEGGAGLKPGTGRNHSTGLILNAGEKLEQYIYLDNSTAYTLEYWSKGKSTVKARIDNVTMVNGELSEIITQQSSGKDQFTQNTLRFTTGPEYVNNKKTVRLVFENTGKTQVVLDDVTIKKK